MPFANEAKKYLASLVLDKIIAVKLLGRDKYRRVVGVVYPVKFIFIFGIDISFALAKKGYATLYTKGGAKYDGKKEQFKHCINLAKKKRKGIWRNGP